MTKQALIIVDMQQGLLSTLRRDADGLVMRINGLAVRLRASRSPVIFIQHKGPDGDHLHPSQPGFAIHNDLIVEPEDVVIKKASCDAFLNTTLIRKLVELEVNEVIITGCATDDCAT